MKKYIIITIFFIILAKNNLAFSKNTLTTSAVFPNENNCYCVNNFEVDQIKNIRIDGERENDENYLFCYNKRVDIHIATNECFGVKNATLSSLPQDCNFTIYDACGNNRKNKFISFYYECNSAGCTKNIMPIEEENYEE